MTAQTVLVLGCLATMVLLGRYARGSALPPVPTNHPHMSALHTAPEVGIRHGQHRLHYRLWVRVQSGKTQNSMCWKRKLVWYPGHIFATGQAAASWAPWLHKTLLAHQHKDALANLEDARSKTASAKRKFGGGRGSKRGERAAKKAKRNSYAKQSTQRARYKFQSMKDELRYLRTEEEYLLNVLRHGNVLDFLSPSSTDSDDQQGQVAEVEAESKKSDHSMDQAEEEEEGEKEEEEKERRMKRRGRQRGRRRRRRRKRQWRVCRHRCLYLPPRAARWRRTIWSKPVVTLWRLNA